MSVSLLVCIAIYLLLLLQIPSQTSCLLHLIQRILFYQNLLFFCLYGLVFFQVFLLQHLQKLIHEFVGSRELVNVFYYVAPLDIKADEEKYWSHQRFLNMLREIPKFKVVLCTLKKIKAKMRRESARLICRTWLQADLFLRIRLFLEVSG